MSEDKVSTVREPNFGDYLKAAFNVRLPVRGLGGLPVNWLYLAVVAGAGVAAPPLLLLGAAGELALLASLATHPRFQQSVRANRLARHDDDIEAVVGALVMQLTPAARSRYEAFFGKCTDILQIARKLGQSDADQDTYAVYLTKLRDVYARMLVFAEILANYTRDWGKSDPLPEMASLEKEIAAGKLPEAILNSRKATLEVLKKRAQSREEVSTRGQLLRSEIQRLEQQLALLRDQALLTQDPSVFSQNMDTAAGVLEEHNTWLQENAGFLQTLNNVNQ